MRSRLRALAFAAILCLAAVPTVAGCGSGSSSSTTRGTTKTPSKGAEPAPESAGPAQPKESASGDQSIQQFGRAANVGDKSAVEGAVHGFLTAIATQDYAGICASLSKSNREQLVSFGSGSCEGALEKLLNPGVAKEAKLAAAAPITSVRVKGGTAFVLFTPRGGSKRYLVMKREGGAWKSIAVTPGTPLAPEVGQG